MSAPFPSAFAGAQDEITRALDAALAGAGQGDRVLAAMRYTLLAPSKRVRAVLVRLAADVCGDGSRALAAAVAVECIHASSLILDDLPCMDDAPLRRGRPSAHVAHGEAVAVLAAFGLLNMAYGHLARAYPPAIAAKITTLYSDAVGLDGLIAGQAEDVLATDAVIDFTTLERIHRRKTGVLFSAAAQAGAVTAGANDAAIASLTAYAKNLGLAFQIVDDLLDVVGTPEETGKAVRADARKTTFVSFSGIDGARDLAAELCATAERALEPFGARANALRELARFVAGRRQ
ncbi:MAG: polyprenyl synthetase family protein [Acidobacteria bacterium]|nr:MAG: polyprenyl synthetase family protein [Acidobacteriota bacterium]